MVGWLIKYELDRIKKELVVAYSRYYLNSCLQGLRKPGVPVETRSERHRIWTSGHVYTGDKLWKDSFVVTVCSIRLNERVFTGNDMTKQCFNSWKSCGGLQICDDFFVLRLGWAQCYQMGLCTLATLLSTGPREWIQCVPDCSMVTTRPARPTY
jgi:hypothetical protein